PGGFMSQLSTGLRAGVLAVLPFTLSPPPGAAQSAGGMAKIPVTTSSSAAREQYLKGRTLGENLRGHDSRQFLEAAAAKDPSFALAHYSLALSSPTAKDFFTHLAEAVRLADKASEGERLMILGLQAGAQSDNKAQREDYERRVNVY